MMIYIPKERRDRIGGRNAESLLVRKKKKKKKYSILPTCCLDWDKTSVNSNTQENFNACCPQQDCFL